MKRKSLAALLLALLLIVSVVSCGKKQETPAGPGGIMPEGKGSSAPAQGGDTAPEKAVAIGVANPYEEIDGDAVLERYGILLKLPETAEAVHWFDINTGGDTGMLQLQFEENGVQYVARARSAARMSNISVVYATFSEEKEIQVAGHKGQLGLTDSGSGVVLWFDSQRSLTLALAATQGAEGDTLTRLAETLYADYPAGSTAPAAGGESGSGAKPANGIDSNPSGSSAPAPQEEIPAPPAATPVSVTIYSPAADGVSFRTETLTTSNLDGDWVASKLKEKGVLDAGVQVLWMELMGSETQGSGELALNLNAAFGKQLAAADARGEYMLMGSVVNSYLNAFGAKRIWIYVEGLDPVSATQTYSTVLTAYGSYEEKPQEEKPQEQPAQEEKPAEPDLSLTEKICQLAESKVGADYEYGAAGPDTFDNSGFVYWVFKECGVTIPRRTSEMYKQGTEIAQSDLKAGDVVFFTYEEDRSPSYVGIYLGGGRFIAENKAGNPVKIMDMTTQYFQEIYIGARRYT